MSTAPQLHDSLYREHLEEASFLFAQRQQWLEDPSIELGDVARLDERLEAHVDGLVIGRDHAWPRCREAVRSGDAGELHAAVVVGCRNESGELLASLGERLAEPDEELRSAAALAFGSALPRRWLDTVAGALADTALQPVLARAIGYHRADLGDALLAAAMRHPEPWTLWALGELRHRPAQDCLRLLARRTESIVTRRAATIAALKLGVRDLVSGDPIVRALVDDDAQLDGPIDADLALALGLRGDERALARLIELLPEGALGATAAGALVLATGARLLEPDDEPNFAELIAAPDDPTKPSRLRPCRDTAVWREHIRECRGRRRTIADNAQSLATLAIPLELRGYLCDELALRFGVDVAIRPDMGARVQLAQLDRLQRGAA